MTAQMMGGGGAGGAQGKFYKGGQFMPGGGRAPKGGAFAGGQSPMGGQSGVNPAQTGDAAGKSSGSMLKGAAAILIISAALFVFAKALQEFDKLQNGWETLAMAAVGLTTLAIAAKVFFAPWSLTTNCLNTARKREIT